jgi:HAD superfamily hydrolase (TIGR01509 family)
LKNKALLLDLDGTLADSLSLLRQTFDRFLVAQGRPPDRVAFERFNGPPMAEIIATLKDELKLELPVNDLLAQYEAMIDEIYEQAAPSQGASEIMAAARASQWAVAVVTSNSARRANLWLNQTGLNVYCSTVVCGEDVSRGKPHPDPYIEALQRLHVSACDACAVEDSPQGAQAALAAGVKTFGYEPEGQAAKTWPESVVAFERFANLQQTLFG